MHRRRGLSRGRPKRGIDTSWLLPCESELGFALAWDHAARASARDRTMEPRETLVVRCSPVTLWPQCDPVPAALLARSRLVTDACGAPVLRDQIRIGRPGTARPMFALGSPNVVRAFLDHALPRAKLLRLRGCLKRATGLPDGGAGSGSSPGRWSPPRWRGGTRRPG